MRLDRAATLYFFHPLTRVFAGNSRPRMSVLMYHSVSNGNEDSVHPYYQVNTAPHVFKEQMRFLKQSGYAVVPLAEVARGVQSRALSKRNCVAITFDDGYRDFLEFAFPILRQYGFPATVFLPTAYIGDTPRIFKGRQCLTWSEVGELHKAGVAFGSHTVTHPQLYAVKDEERGREVRDSKTAIEDCLGCAVESFSYPYAFPEQDGGFQRKLRTLLEECGYRFGVSTILGTVGTHEDHFFLKRLPTNSRDDTPLFRAKLEGGYNWLHGFQYASKSLRYRAR
jgi:peptidoglycan/xylan/chitin deacetylase (PgdA/CDA1 family)